MTQQQYESLWKPRKFRGRDGRMLELAGPDGKAGACLFLYRPDRYMSRPNPIEIEFMTGSARKIIDRHSFPPSMPEHQAAATAMAAALSYSKEQTAFFLAVTWSIEDAAKTD